MRGFGGVPAGAAELAVRRGGACLEVAVRPRTIHIRDSKLGTQSPRFAVRCDAWAAFLAYASREI
ncbi:DUF397 domain-containing protein [Streptomyces sp. NPDC001435]|uniref:DUF397 domain-containing protein n=1 Tax=unclassified Streptomyces TaxID=2593676 RepID=UPI0036AFEA5B